MTAIGRLAAWIEDGAPYEPDWAYQGDQLRVTLTGEHLLFVQEDLVVDLGGGLSVLETEVVDVDTARLLVAVDAGAKSEPREVMVTSGDLTASLAGGFEVVVDGAQRPQLTSVDPTFVTQGTEAELIVLASHSFADLPTVDLGEGVVVADVQWFDDTELHVSVVVELDAPLGEHALEVDDGERIFGGLRVQVRDDPPATTRCSTAPGSRGWVWGLVALCGACRSRRMVSPR